MPLCGHCRSEATVTRRGVGEVNHDPSDFPELDEPCSRCGERR